MLCKQKKNYKLLAIFFCMMLLFVGCTTEAPKDSSTTEAQMVEKEDFVLGTHGKIRVFADSEAKGNEAIEKAFDRIVEIENRMSTSIEGSDINTINKNAGGEAVKAEAETISVIEKGIRYADITNGTFNIGIGSLIELWGIGKDWQKVPTGAEILQAKSHTDLSKLEMTENQVSIKDPEMRIDLGGIAKGYAVDEAARVLRENGINSGFVNMGGDVYALGSKPDGSPWNVGIQNPEIGVGGVIAKIELVDQSIVTSGDYERYFIENGQHYHHILDPETGYPSKNELNSVTIISEKAIDGDALSTAVFVMGLEEGLSFVEAQENIEAVLVTKDKKVYTTSGMVDKVEILDESYVLQK